MATPLAEYPATGINVVVVGAGYGGLTTAIECHLKGHNVIVLERSTEWKHLGDIIGISPNAGRIVSRWDPVYGDGKMRSVSMSAFKLKLYTHTGDFILQQVFPLNPTHPHYNGHRADLHRCLYEYAVALGIDVRMGQRVISYHDDDKGAWVILESEERIDGDIVVASDGLRSRAKKAILQSNNVSIGSGKDQGVEGMWKEKSTGYSVYRAWFTAEEAGLHSDPQLKFLTEKDHHMGWLGGDIHFLVASLNGGEKISWIATHPVRKADGEEEEDYQGDGEDWMNPIRGKVKEALSIFTDEWHPIARAIVARTPAAGLIDWPIITREPLPTITSRNGHLLLLGDAAHPFLPTAIQGASQAMEDGVVLATYLSLSHFDSKHSKLSKAEKTKIAVKSWQRMRSERVKAAQKTGEAVMEQWHTKEGEEKPEHLELPREEWLLGHDAEAWSRKVWDEVREEVCRGRRVRRERLAAGPESEEVLEMSQGLCFGAVMPLGE